jgi:hypothetical protein
LLEEVAELARECLEMTGDRQPAMRDVVLAQHDPEEMESLLGQSSVGSLETVSTGNFSMEKRDSARAAGIWALGSAQSYHIHSKFFISCKRDTSF